jgi:hypothetical protein
VSAALMSALRAAANNRRPPLRYVSNSELPQARPLQPGRTITPSDERRNVALAAAIDRALAPTAPLWHDVAASRFAAPAIRPFAGEVNGTINRYRRESNFMRIRCG